MIAGRARRFAQFTVPIFWKRATTRPLASRDIAIVISYTVITSYQFKGGGDILHLIFPPTERTTGMVIIAGFRDPIHGFRGHGVRRLFGPRDRLDGDHHRGDCGAASVERRGRLEPGPPSPAREPFHSAWRRRALPGSRFSIPTMLLLVGNQGMYQKFFSARSEKDANYAVVGWIIGTLLLETLLIMFAVIGSAKFHTEQPREIIPLTARQGLPVLLGAILLGGIFAKVISTANNYLFSPATNLIHDVYERFINRSATDRQSLIVSRLLVDWALGLFALLQAAQFENILKASLYAYTIYGAAVTPVVLAVFFWRRTTTAGAVVSIALGNRRDGRAGTSRSRSWDFRRTSMAVYPALAASVLSLIVVSLMTSPPAESKWRPFFTAPELEATNKVA